MIEITGCDLVKLTQKAYELSVPQGLGFLHYVEGGLSEDEAKSLIFEDEPWGPLNLDYVKGRAVKLNVRSKDGKWFLDDSWYDHTDDQYKELLQSIGIDYDIKPEHNCSCNCTECQIKRGN